MSEAWILRTNGDALAAIRRFLADLWPRAGLEGLVAPVYQVGERRIKPLLLEDPGQLDAMDPFAPLVSENTAGRVVKVASERREGRFGAVLRSCEARALQRMVHSGLLDLERWLIVGVDCLPSFPAEEFEWRIQKAGNLQQLTRQALRFARQGGIAPYRYRQACQMCLSPEPLEVDLCICLYGLPVSEFMLVKANRESTARELRLEEITFEQAPASMLAHHERMLATLKQRRAGVRQRSIASLPADLPSDVRSLIAWIKDCEPCRKCLEACPIYAGELDTVLTEGGMVDETALSWLASCLACGMCEEACPKQLPLTAIKTSIAEHLLERVPQA